MFHAALAGLVIGAGRGFGPALDGEAVLRRGPQLRIIGAAERHEIAPYPRGLVLGRGGDALAVGAKCCINDHLLVTTKDQRDTRSIGVPHPCRRVGGRGDDALAIGAKCRINDPPLVTAKEQRDARSIGAPHPYRCVGGRGDDTLAVGAKYRSA